MLASLTALGFTDIQPVESFDELSVGSLTIVPPPAAEGGVVEHGFVVADGDQTIWNLVDTVPSPAGVAAVKARFPEIDLAFVPWMPLQDAEFQNGVPISFPYRMYDALVSNILQTGARAISAGSCGYQAIGTHAWSNHLIFPQTRDRFAMDIVAANPAWRGQIYTPDPGDALELSGGAVRTVEGTLDYCESDPYDWRRVQWRPFELGFAVTEGNEGCTTAALSDSVGAFFDEAMRSFAREHHAELALNRRWEVIHQYEVVCSDGSVFWTLDYRGPELEIREERTPLALKHSVIEASALLGLVAGAVSWEFVLLGGAYRHHDHTYRMDPAGVHTANGVPIVDPIQAMLSSTEVLARKVATDVARLTGGESFGDRAEADTIEQALASGCIELGVEPAAPMGDDSA